MATVIPSIGICASRMTAGERRLAERLEQKLDDDYLVWYDVPVGPRQGLLSAPWSYGVVFTHIEPAVRGGRARAGDRAEPQTLGCYGDPAQVPTKVKSSSLHPTQLDARIRAN